MFSVGPGTIPSPWTPVNAGPPGALGSADTNGSMVDSKNLDVGDMSDVSLLVKIKIKSRDCILEYFWTTCLPKIESNVFLFLIEKYSFFLAMFMLNYKLKVPCSVNKERSTVRQKLSKKWQIYLSSLECKQIFLNIPGRKGLVIRWCRRCMESRYRAELSRGFIYISAVRT